jgi:two-component system osmolarity sensor histidine kinase EnvZ
LYKDDEFVTFRVEDNGPGIPPEERENALKPFARLDPARNQNKGSSVGLGLPIANDIARAHGGQLHLSDALQGGLRIDMRIAT